MYVIIIILIVVLLIAAIFINAVQQHRAKIESERRAEVSKQKAIIDETENVIMACVNIPTSPRLMEVLHNRVLNALKVINEHNSTPEIKQRINDAEQRTSSGSDGTVTSDFVLPDNDRRSRNYVFSFARNIVKAKWILKRLLMKKSS